MKVFVLACTLVGILFHLSQAAVYTEENFRDFRRKCSKVLRTPTEVMQQIEDVKDHTSDNQELHCFFRCMGILSGFYDDETGANWELVAQHLEGKQGFEQHRKTTTECIQALPEEEEGQSEICRKAYLSFRCAIESAKQHLLDKSYEPVLSQK